MRSWFAVFACLALCAGCTSKNHAAEAGQAPVEPASAWTVTSHDPSGGAPALLWNGLIGVRIAKNGGGLASDGKPLGFFMIDEYEKGGEEKILQMPNPILVTWAVGNSLYSDADKEKHDFLKSGGTPLDPRNGTGYTQQLDMKTGTLHTEWSQKTPGGDQVKISCDTIVHPADRTLGQRWTLQCSKQEPFSIRTLDYGGPTDKQESIGSDANGDVAISSSPTRAVTMTTKITGCDVGRLATVGGFRIQEGAAYAGKALTFDRVLSFGPHSDNPLPEFTEKNANELQKVAPKPVTYDELSKQTAGIWANRWRTDIVIDGPTEDQQAIHSFLFYLRSAISPKGQMGISPFGLSDLQYNGHVFWDADIWVFPALALIDPAEAKAIPDYRLAKSDAAVENFRKWFKTTAAGSGNLPVQPSGMKFPWESSVTGMETAPGESKLEEHITGSVVWGLTQASRLGLEEPRLVDKASAMAANNYLARATHLPGGAMALQHVMSPDENHTGDNDLYTNLLAQWLCNGRTWNSGLNFVLPKDQTSFLTYDKDPLRSYKQAAAILSIYPLQYPPAEAQAKTMIERFAPKVIPNGPAMSNSVNATIYARLDDPEKAYDEWHKSWQPYTKDPLLLFSEKKSKLTTYFTTGAGGSLQALLYGLLGFRIDLKPEPGSAWSKRLLGNSFLSVKPHLPREWKSVKFQNFTVLKDRYTLEVTPQGAKVTSGE
ncbi:MAG TPA: glycosyl hydrolase family 65 protein [Fimbriimonas sp.]|nr:glycosyl hydrolase family 65 protein [Fimbriimonas sp.]